MENLIFFLSLPEKECCNLKDLVQLGDGNILALPILVGSCDGLVCLCDKDKNDSKLSLWNPAIDAYREITNPGKVPNVLAYGFGYASSIDDSKIAASFGTPGEKFRGFFVFSVGGMKWKTIVGRFHRRYLPLAVTLDDKALFIDGILYWPPTGYTSRGKAKHMIGFDLNSEKFEEFPWIDDINMYSKVDLFRFKGCLTFRGRDWKNFDVWDFWMLKKVDGSSSWEKLFSVDLTNVSFFCFSETDDKCLVWHFEQFKLIDPCKEALECFRGDVNFCHIAESRDYVESLVSPFVTTNFDEEVNSNETSDSSEDLIMDDKLLQNKRVTVSQAKESDNDEDDDGNESDFEVEYTNLWTMDHCAPKKHMCISKRT
ncbi:uncharacterized protein [Spinacia oleracea]|uniref:F-box associated beta-propeller type 1 domain-containing protein n=1 Tax=Spinacia oleracea TaxID=3562 RepID=A0A9R0IYI4_SPIOL|nr:uncharacterized protein LOC110797228 [Spinacia oleracea]